MTPRDGFGYDAKPRVTAAPRYGDYGLHPNLFGYGQMADAWAKAIAERVKK